jgi:tetratricopeptide (TPR) repeat protein
MRFTETDAAKAFEAGRYEEAVTELLRLRETNPENLLVLRYLAMSYDRVGRFADALKTFAAALQRSPRNVALLYHSGETLYRTHYADDARRHFRLVLELGADTEYASYARAYLDALAQQQAAARQSPGAPRRFGVFLEIGAQRDEYDTVAADGVTPQESESDRITENLSLEWYLLRRADWVANLELGGYGAQYVGRCGRAQGPVAVLGGRPVAAQRPLGPRTVHGHPAWIAPVGAL